jgi:hypothetical protein
MKVSVEIPVIASGFAGRVQSTRPIVGSFPEEFDIPDYSPAEVPVVIQVEDVRAATNVEKADDPEISAVVARYTYCGVDGRLFVPANGICDGTAVRFDYEEAGGSKHPFFADQRLYLSRRIAAMDKWETRNELLPKALSERLRGLRETYTVETMTALNAKQLDQVEVERQLESVRKRIDRFISVGGRLFIAVPEPLLAVNTTSTVPELSLVTRSDGESFTDWTAREPQVRRDYYNLLEIDEAKRQARDQQKPGSPPFADRIHSVTVVDPSFVKADGSALTLAHMARCMLLAFAGQLVPSGMSTYAAQTEEMASMLAKVSRAALEACKDIEEGLSLTTGNDVSPLLELGLEFALSGREDARPFVAGRNAMEDVRRLRRWTERSVGFGFTDGMRLG